MLLSLSVIVNPGFREADGGFVYRASMMIREHREEDPREASIA